MAKKTLSTLALGVLYSLLPGPVWASTDGGGPSSVLFLLSLFTIALTFGCFVMAIKIYSLLKKGELALSWQLLGLSFLLLGVAQFLDMIEQGGWLQILPGSPELARIAALGLFIFSLHRTNKILS